MNIRTYRTEDHRHVVTLWHAVFPGSTDHNDPTIAIEKKVNADDGLFFVATDGDVVVGTVLAGYDGHRGWLYSLAVDAERRRKGIGTQLVRHAESALSAKGCMKVNLQVRANNSEVVAFYQSLGFETEPRISMGKRLR